MYWKYLSYVIRHKWFVFLECRKEGLWFRGLWHDMSKLLPSEFGPYARYFYGNKGDIHRRRDETGYYKSDTGDLAFDVAWLQHQHRNPHHWQHWILVQDEEDTRILEMPMKYRIEMLCDWKGAGKAQGVTGTGVKEWYDKNGVKMQLGQETRKWIEKELKI